MELTHGGDWAGFEREYGYRPLDFSASISPFGLPDGVRSAAVEALADAGSYPDPLCRALRGALAAYHGVPEARIVCGNGSAELIWRLCRALRPKRAAVFVPGFTEYALALRAGDCRITEIPLPSADGFRMTEDCLAQIPRGCGLIFLCNPNNPTGLLAERELLMSLLCRCRENGTILALDECFLDFCEHAAAHSLIGMLEAYPELVILRAFTKTHAMAGLRLGYALCGDAGLAERLQACGQPWAVSSVAQAAGLAALRENDYVNHMRTLIGEERRRMKDALSVLGLRVIPGEANFLLFHCGDAKLAEKLRKRGILIRDCSNDPGLYRGWYRTAIRTAEENNALLAALSEVYHG